MKTSLDYWYCTAVWHIQVMLRWKSSSRAIEYGHMVFQYKWNSFYLFTLLWLFIFVYAIETWYNKVIGILELFSWMRKFIKLKKKISRFFKNLKFQCNHNQNLPGHCSCHQSTPVHITNSVRAALTWSLPRRPGMDGTMSRLFRPERWSREAMMGEQYSVLRHGEGMKQMYKQAERESGKEAISAMTPQNQPPPPVAPSSM